MQSAAVEASLRSIDTLRRAGVTAALLLAVFGAIVTFMGITTLSDVTNFARSEVLKTIARQAKDSGEALNQITDLKLRYERASAEAENLLNEINSRRNELRFLTEMDVNTPTLNYFVLAGELDQIHSEYQAQLQSYLFERSGPPPSIQRLLGDEMRDKAAAVFSTLITGIEDDADESSVDVSRDTLFNAAADAFRINFNAIGLRLILAAKNIGAADEPIPAEHEARLLRAQLQLQQVKVADALARVPDVLAKSNAVNLHLVVSEIWNVGLQSGAPVVVAQHLIDYLERWDGEPASYSLVTIGRLFGLSHRTSDWERGRCFVRLAVARWQNEPPSVQWESQSAQQIQRAVAELEVAELSVDTEPMSVGDCL